MSLSTQFPGWITTGELPADIIWGTAQIGDDFGPVQSANLDRTGDTNEILNGKGGLRALLLDNIRSEFTLDVLFTDDVDAPGLGELIVLPLLVDEAGENPICATILKASVKWEAKGARMLSISATNWDSLGARPEAKSYNPDTEEFVAVAQTVALPAEV
jgi:hypothetical protein